MTGPSTSLRSLASIAALSITFCGHLAAQSTFGSIVGTVADQSGGVIADARVEARSLADNTFRTAISSKEGLFEILHLKPGRYSLTVTMGGFARARVPEVLLLSRQAVRADVVLTVAPVEDSVVVLGKPSSINTEGGAIADSKSFAEVSQLPLNYRGSGTSPIPNALFIVPGVMHDLSNQPAIAGGLPHQVEYSVDGISIVNVRANGPNPGMAPSTEMLAEFQVTLSGGGAEHGQPGDVTLVSKSGGNALHGSALWFHQNAALDAKTYASPAKQAKVFNTLGGSLSGPVRLPGFYDGRNKSFFFVSGESNLRPASTLVQGSVPSAPMRLGSLNGVGGSRAFDPSGNTPFPGNAIPSSRLNPVARTLLSDFIPLPNFGDAGTLLNYRIQLSTPSATHGYDIRADHAIDERHQLYARWSWKSSSAAFSNGLLPASDVAQLNRNLVLSYNYGIRPNLLHELRLGWSYFAFDEAFPVVGKQAVERLGIEGLEISRSGLTGGFPYFDFGDGTGFTYLAHGRDGRTDSRSLQLTDALSWIRNRHTMKFGFDVRRLGYDGVVHVPWNDEFGGFLFLDGRFSGNAFADLLLGLPAQTAYAALGPNLAQRTTHFHAYAQDEWHIGHRLNIQFGIRWSLHPPMTELSGNLSNFDRATGAIIVPDRTLPAAPGFLATGNVCPGTTAAVPCTKFVTASQMGLGQGLRKTYFGNWAPRFGFAYRPFGGNRFVLRGSAGVFTHTVLGRLAYGTTGIHASDWRIFDNYQGPGQPPQFSLPRAHAGQFALNQVGASSVGDFTNLDYRDPRTYQWNFSFERELARGAQARLSYVGSQSVGLNLLAQLNQQRASQSPYDHEKRPYRAWNNITSWENLGFSKFHSLQVETSRRLANSAFFQASYALSKNVGNAGSVSGGIRNLPGEGFGQPVTDPFNTRLDRGNLSLVRRHRVLLTAIVPLPFGNGRRWGANWKKVHQFTAGGWSFSTVTFLESGPFQTPTIALQRDQSNTNALGRGGFARPDRIADGNLPAPTPERYYDLAAFPPTPAGAGRFGNAGVGILRGPGAVTVAAGLAKEFPLIGRARLRLEGTFTNLANHPNFVIPSVVVSTPSTFGKLTSVQSSENSGNRSGQVGIRLEF